MSVARLRALTHEIFLSVSISPLSRNECCPFEGIDTTLVSSGASHTILVEMSVARLRALTQNYCCWLFFMYKLSRNECCPFEGIDTG